MPTTDVDVLLQAWAFYRGWHIMAGTVHVQRIWGLR